MQTISLPIKKNDPRAVVPRRAHVGDAGIDLCATEDVTLMPFERTLVPTGLSMAIPEGFGGFVLPRSGAAIKQGLSIVNAPGLIDAGYRGEVKVIAINLDAHTPIQIKAGDRVAQLVVMPVPVVDVVEVDELDATERGEGGFGSTGK